MGVLERVDSGEINEGYIFVFTDEGNQEKLLPIQEQSKLTWKALAEAHLRERVKNPIAERGGNSGKTSFEITSTYNCSQYPSSEEY